MTVLAPQILLGNFSKTMERALTAISPFAVLLVQACKYALESGMLLVRRQVRVEESLESPTNHPTPKQDLQHSETYIVPICPSAHHFLPSFSPTAISSAPTSLPGPVLSGTHSASSCPSRCKYRLAVRMDLTCFIATSFREGRYELGHKSFSFRDTTDWMQFTTTRNHYVGVARRALVPIFPTNRGVPTTKGTVV